jgi:hypothetical protein
MMARQPAGREFGQPPQAGILEIIALLREFVLPDREPYQGRSNRRYTLVNSNEGIREVTDLPTVTNTLQLYLVLSQCMHDDWPGDRCSGTGKQRCKILFYPFKPTLV